MRRTLPLVFVALLLGAVFLLPQPRPANQLARQVGALLELQTPLSPEEAAVRLLGKPEERGELPDSDGEEEEQQAQADETVDKLVGHLGIASSGSVTTPEQLLALIDELEAALSRETAGKEFIELLDLPRVSTSEDLRTIGDLQQQLLQKRGELFGEEEDPGFVTSVGAWFMGWFTDPPQSVAEVLEGPSLFERIRATSAFVEDDDRTLQFRLFGVRVAGDANADADITDNIVARKSLARAMRTKTLERDGRELDVLGELAPRADVGGAGFEIQLVGRTAGIAFSMREGEDRLLFETTQEFVSPNRLSLLPPLIAVALAVLLRKPLLALFSGVFAGSVLINFGRDVGLFKSIALGFSEVFTGYLHAEMTSSDRWLTVGFVFFMLAMVGVMTRAGGIQGLMDSIARIANNAKRTQIATFLMGLAIFFDDYANTILVGSTMRSLSDRFRIAREKLAYLVDSTAAPVAGLSVFSTWIAFEVSTYSAQLPTAGMSPSDGYAVFFRTIPYSFYCVLTIVFVGLIAFTGKDLGPMLEAERRARRTGKLVAEGSTPMVGEDGTDLSVAKGVIPKAWRAITPLFTFLLVTIGVILYSGGAFDARTDLWSMEGFIQVLYNGSGYKPLFLGSLAGFLMAAIGAIEAGAGKQIVAASWTTIRSMWVAFAILYLAWMIGNVCTDLGTAPYLTSIVDGLLDAKLLPTIVFILAGLVALATGSSWSTMSILLPLVVPLAFALGEPAGLAATPAESGQLLMVICIAAVLSGSIFGDHCSPISDTTVMSSISAASDHIDHVRTQAPYAILVTVVAVVTGYLPATYLGLSPWISLLLGSVVLAALVIGFGRRADDTPREAG